MDTRPLFRPEALDSCKSKALGEIIFVRPISFTVVTMLALAMAAMIICVAVWGSYTRRSTVIGELVPNMGILKVYAHRSAVVLKKYVQEGDRVKKGQVLFLASGDHNDHQRSGVQAAISRHVERREGILRRELREQREIQHQDLRALRMSVKGLLAEHEELNSQVTKQKARIKLAESALARAEQLTAQGYIAAAVLQEKQGDVIDQESRLHALERDRIRVEGDLLLRRGELISLPARQSKESAQIERQISITDQELVESEGKHRIAFTAPGSGIATGVTAEVGQAVDGTVPLVSIIPDGSVLQAHLFAPSRAIGLIRPRDRVLLRYQAYPYQKFGHAHGEVASVSRTALTLNELTRNRFSPIENSQAHYRIIVNLDKQEIQAFGHSQPLQAGMAVEADVMHETRRIYEWVLEPLLSLTGKL